MDRVSPTKDSRDNQCIQPIAIALPPVLNDTCGYKLISITILNLAISIYDVGVNLDKLSTSSGHQSIRFGFHPIIANQLVTICKLRIQNLARTD